MAANGIKWNEEMCLTEYIHMTGTMQDFKHVYTSKQ